jgi:hypothetical protein
LNVGGLALPQLLHSVEIAVPHWPQKRADAEFSKPQELQSIDLPNARGQSVSASYSELNAIY